MAVALVKQGFLQLSCSVHHLFCFYIKAHYPVLSRLFTEIMCLVVGSNLLGMFVDVNRAFSGSI